MGNVLLLFVVTGLSIFSGARAARPCRGNTNAVPTYEWRVGDARYDGADPSKPDGLATVAISVTPSNGYTLFECVAQWPQNWAGWYEGGNDSIIWSDCIWTGNGPTNDATTSFALDWRNRTMYLSHTFNCSDEQGVDALASGSIGLGFNCTGTSANETYHCALQEGRPTFMTELRPAQPNVSSTTCANHTEQYQSWQLEDWQRSYEMNPESAYPGYDTAPSNDTGPSFALKNMKTMDVFRCATLRKQNTIFDGVCNSTTTTATARFHFDPDLDMLTITQDLGCGSTVSASSLNVTGVAYVQAGCDRQGNMLTCSSDPLWIGAGVP